VKFYGKGTVWNPVKNKALCKFVNGIFETSDNDTIEMLIDLGYNYDKEQVPENIEYEKMKLKELQELAKENGLKNFTMLRKNELIKFLRGELNE
jgi:hypothetical protein